MAIAVAASCRWRVASTILCISSMHACNVPFWLFFTEVGQPRGRFDMLMLTAEIVKLHVELELPESHVV